MAASIDSAGLPAAFASDAQRVAETRRGRIVARDRGYQLRRLLAAADCTAVALGAILSTGITSIAASDVDRVAWTLLTLPAWIPLFKIYGLYDRDAKRISHSTIDDVPWIFHALLVGSVVLWLLYKVVPVDEPTIGELGIFFAATFAMLLLARSGARATVRWTLPPERVLFVGAGASAVLLEKKMRAHPELQLDPVGYLTLGEAGADESLDLPHLGRICELESVCSQNRIDRVLLVSQSFEDEELAETTRRLKDLPVQISLLPRIGDVLGPSVEVDDVEGVAVFGMNAAVLTRSSQLLKRTMDLAIAVPATVAALPLMAVAAVAIKLDSPGPMLYTQERIGRRGVAFRIYKLRTMVTDAEERVAELQTISRHEAWLHLDHDPRITRVGRLLRRSSIDELPQLFNVIRGSMSLVGPRPMTPDVDSRISGWGRRRLDLTPGITGLWQVLGRTNIPFEEMVALDYLYVTNWSLWQDIRLLIRTLPIVLTRRGAN